ncbi:SDR family NAD(P)-dependent oxidoreductase [Gryllotalpicola protaetiae]|uniref:SDR family NAD(P)-dependent oxidoreductase n=1 Tax=Gryllotalpicola protaetiae TaxID=2419771 RepID=A0A387BUQ7_9MICO|nr:SDR family NAD(P)-dependent oxidoreductase [Gryllotalpicola protaetiae]AYG04806.1 SDR family NAD(P)-dependent oxidoreductase [Gryllotalpicola protaetiae]
MTQKVALVTGAGRANGLGMATAQALAELGFHIIVTSRSDAQSEEQAQSLREAGFSAEGYRLDLGDPTEFARVAERIRVDHGHLDALINNASVFPDMGVDSALDVSIEHVKAAFDVDVIGPWLLTVALRGVLEAAPAARVVNLSSGAYQQIASLPQNPGDVGAPAYSFAKHTLNYLTQILAAAFRDTKVLVNSVDPGRADTHPELGTDEEDVPPSVAAAWIAQAATLPEGGASGVVFADGEIVG